MQTLIYILKHDSYRRPNQGFIVSHSGITGVSFINLNISIAITQV